MKKYVVTNGNGEYYAQTSPMDIDFGASKEKASEFTDLQHAKGIAKMGNILNQLGDAEDAVSAPFKVVEA